MKLPIPNDNDESTTFARAAGGPYWLGLTRECSDGPCTDFTSIYSNEPPRNASWAEGAIDGSHKVEWD